MKANKFLTIPIMALLLWLTGCKGDEPVNPEPMGDNLPMPQVTFRLSLSSESLGTRAASDSESHNNQTWTPSSTTDAYAVGIDNKITSLRAVLYAVVGEGDNERLNYQKPIAELKNIKYIKDTEEIDIANCDNVSGIVTVTGTLDCDYTAKELEEGKFRIAVFVNPPSSLNIENPGICLFTEHGPSENFTSVLGGLPMYGVADVTFPDLPAHTSGNYSLKGADRKTDLSINILRSVAKIKVIVDNSVYADEGKTQNGKHMRLISMKVERHAKRGYLCPSGWNTTSDLASLSHNAVWRPAEIKSIKEDFDTACVVKPYSGSDETLAADNENRWRNSDKMLRFYTPDTPNSDNDILHSAEQPLKLLVKYSIGTKETNDYEENEAEIFLCQYDGGVHDTNALNHKRFDIIRNHIYQFRITNVTDKLKLECEVSIQKWGYHRISTEL